MNTCPLVCETRPTFDINALVLKIMSLDIIDRVGKIILGVLAVWESA